MFLILVLLGCSSAQLRKDTQDSLVNAHNDLRSSVAKGMFLKGTRVPKASNMRKMKWDSSLATAAQNLANSCPNEQYNGAEYGENVFVWYTKVPQTVDSIGVLAGQFWYSEFGKGSNATNLNNIITKKTQMALAEIDSIGCAVKNCRTDPSKGILIKYVAVCKYRVPFSRQIMRIRSYPSLINRQIIQEMNPSANFMLSKTSKKMKDLVKNNIYKVDQVWVDFSLNVAFVIEIDGKIYKVLDLSDDRVLRKGMYRFLINTVMLHSSVVDDYREILTNHNYICEIFKCESSRISVVDSSEAFIDSQFHIEDSYEFLWNVDFCHLRVLGSPPSMKIPHLIVDNSQFKTMDFMNYYDGKNIVLKNAWLDDGLGGVLILNWIMESRENVVSFIAFQDAQKVSDQSRVVAFLNSKRNAITEERVEDWNPAKRDRFYKYDSIIANHHVFPEDTFDCEHGYDIVREDGKRATVKVSPNYFMFFVWP
ncbi:hypothetical protein B9Z55_015392 [Caenorhabditis nigoni]|nr:hypothetical protein B9Z55_015392 [Caenorhabditis nigoni]